MKPTLFVPLACAALSLIWVLGTPPAGFLSGTVVDQLASKLVNMNRLKVALGDGLSAADLRIDLHAETHPPRTVFARGVTRGPIPYSYGHHRFLVFLDGVEVGRVSHFRENDWQSNAYLISVSFEGDKVSVHLQVAGP